jgi:high-affinity iron transporter
LVDCEQVQPAFVLTFREGLGAFVVVAVILAFFHTSGTPRLVGAVRWGIGVSVPASAIAGALFSTAENQALWEGVMALLCASGVAWLAAYMWGAAHAREHHPTGRMAWLLTMVVTALLIARGGMEIALLVGTMVLQVRASPVLLGATFGVIAAALLAWSWSRLGRRVHLGTLRHVTTMFFVLFFVHLLVDGFHEVAEAGVISGTEAVHWATEPYSADGVYGQYAPYLLVVLPLVWLLVDGFHEVAEAGVISGTEAVHWATEPYSADGVYGQYAPYLLIVLPLGWLLVAILLGHGKASDGRVAHVGR